MQGWERRACEAACLGGVRDMADAQMDWQDRAKTTYKVGDRVHVTEPHYYAGRDGTIDVVSATDEKQWVVRLDRLSEDKHQLRVWVGVDAMHPISLPKSKHEAKLDQAEKGYGPPAYGNHFRIGDHVRVKAPTHGMAPETVYTVAELTNACVRLAGQTSWWAHDIFVSADKRGPGLVSGQAVLGTNAGVKSEAQQRKDKPLMRGLLDYFPDALMAIAEISRLGNEQHHPGAPLHWEFDKSSDHADCAARHLVDRGTKDTDGADHSGKAAWRAIANYQVELERADPELHARRQAQRDAAAKGQR